jgi:hypothetical protein
MPWYDPLTGTSFAEWLKSTGQRYRLSERKLDFHATSMRDLDDVAPNLDDLYAGRPLRVTDPSQRVTDLVGWAFIDRGPPVTLTALGEEVKETWHKYGTPLEKDDELARELLYAG